MQIPVKIVLSAISGYGYYYLKTLLEEISPDVAVLAGVIDPQPEKSGFFHDVLKMGVPIYPDMDQFFAEGHTANLTVISSPIHFHVPQAVTALINGSNVLVDKPISGSVREAEELIRVKNETGRFVEVGYQWSFSEAIRNLRRDILSGFYGEPVRMKTICLWPRDDAYYGRNSWAGRILSADGRPVNDSPANNACAHFIHNLFFLAGIRYQVSGIGYRVSGIRCRVYDIENYDTVAARVRTPDGIEIFFYFSHASEHPRNPEFVLELKHGIVQYGGEFPEITGIHQDGTVRKYGSPDDTHQFKKLFAAIEAVNNPKLPVCPPESAIFQTVCVEELQKSPIGIVNFPRELVVEETGRRCVKGLAQKLGEAYDKWKTEEF